MFESWDGVENQNVVRLKKEIENLRLSRRVLMSLIEAIEKERLLLEDKNRQLQKNNSRYAKTILSKNIEIKELRLRLTSANDLE